MPDYDAIVIGAGNNGLATSMLLQKNGLKVLNLEKNKFVGGMAGNAHFWPGHTNQCGAWVMFIAMQEVWDMLEIEKYGFETIIPDSLVTSVMSKDRPAFTMYADPQKLFEHVQKEFGEQTMLGFMAFLFYLRPFIVAMQQAVLNPAISLGKMLDSMPSVEGKDAMRRVFFSPVSDLLNEFMPGDEAEVIKGGLAMYSSDGLWGGPMTPGSLFNLAFHMASGEKSGLRLVKGGIGKYSEAIAKAFQAHGGELRLSTPIKKVVVKNNKAVGVQLENGEEISADLVVSNCTARYSFMNLIGEENLPAQFTGMVKTIKYENAYIQFYLRLKGLPHFTGRHEHLNEGKTGYMLGIHEGLMGAETAWDDCKHGRLPSKIMSNGVIASVYDRSLAPEGEHNWCMFTYYFPVTAPRDKWKGLAEQLADRTIDAYSQYIPNMKDIILDRKILTPADYEQQYNATGGCFCHGRFGLDQLLDFRPVPGWANYATPVDNFYLCGSATHPGWGVTSFSGVNAANAILKNRSKKSQKKR